MGDKNFRNKLDSELKGIVFSDESRNRVLERAAGHRMAAAHGKTAVYGRAAAPGSSDGYSRASLHVGIVNSGNAAASGRRLPGVEPWRERFRSFMDLELRIPVKPLVVALLITVSGIVYACVGITRVSAEDIRRSSITVVDSNQGGQSDGIYKDKG